MRIRGLSISQVGLLTLIGAVTVCSGSTPAATAAGGNSFLAITSASGPEEFPWTVNLGDDQELKAIDDRNVGVFYEDGHSGFVITATPARDAEGTSVPTTLAVSGVNVITLTVHHRAGNPLTGGTPFVYPVVAGAGWEGGFRTYVVQMPPGEFPPTSKVCSVPKLKDKKLKVAKTLLRAANCTVGRVRKLSEATAKTGRVVKQNPTPGAQLADGAAVRVTLGKR